MPQALDRSDAFMFASFGCSSISSRQSASRRKPRQADATILKPDAFTMGRTVVFSRFNSTSP